MNYCKPFIVCGIVLFCLCLLAACGGPTTVTTNKAAPSATATQLEVSTNPTMAATASSTAIQTGQTPRPVGATPIATTGNGGGPQIILTPTPVPGGGAGSQRVTLGDRTMTISSVSQQPGNSTGSTAVTLVMAIKDTGAKAIQNQAGFYQLVGSEGDIFGVQSSATPGFFGTISPQGTLSGTIVFQVPTAGANGLRLLFRPEVVSETVFVSL